MDSQAGEPGTVHELPVVHRHCTAVGRAQMQQGGLREERRCNRVGGGKSAGATGWCATGWAACELGMACTAVATAQRRGCLARSSRSLSSAWDLRAAAAKQWNRSRVQPMPSSTAQGQPEHSAPRCAHPQHTALAGQAGWKAVPPAVQLAPDPGPYCPGIGASRRGRRGAAGTGRPGKRSDAIGPAAGRWQAGVVNVRVSWGTAGSLATHASS